MLIERRKLSHTRLTLNSTEKTLNAQNWAVQVVVDNKAVHERRGQVCLQRFVDAYFAYLMAMLLYETRT